MPKDKTVLIRCKKDGQPLALIAGTHGETLAVCPDCGGGWKYEEVANNSAGLVAGLISPEQLVELREQIRVARKEGR